MSAAPSFEIVDETGSTNADLIARIGVGETIAEHHWLRAERQTGGKGRQGRKWESPAGNLYCSTVVNLRQDDPIAHTLSFVAGLACYEALVRSLLPGTPVMLKWPNDALIRGAKLAGILLERRGDSVVVGIGVNVCHAPHVSGRETTSVVDENGKHGGAPQLVLDLVAQQFVTQLDRWRNEPLAATLDQWTAAAHQVGTQLSVGEGDAKVVGAFAGLDHQGALLLRLANGTVETIHAGDVSLMAEKE